LRRRSIERDVLVDRPARNVGQDSMLRHDSSVASPWFDCTFQSARYTYQESMERDPRRYKNTCRSRDASAIV
jgi:hypothetical protein